MVGFGGFAGQKKIVDTAVTAGVQRIVPSEFSHNTTFPAFRTVSVFGAKIEMQEYLKKVSADSGLSCTIVVTGPFLDWGHEDSRVFLLESLNRRKV
jgi:hypothetical protein